MSASKAIWITATFLVGLSAGFFFTYEASVTRGLAQVDDVTYVHTFQAINETVSNPWFALVFFGSVPALVAALVIAWRSTVVVRSLTAAALALYLAGIAVTGMGNVPLNDELAGYDDVTIDTAAVARSDFETDWNRLNLIRTVAIGAGFACLLTAYGLHGAQSRSSSVAGSADRAAARSSSATTSSSAVCVKSA